jgi:DNA-binding NtrC family response regulator
MPDILIVDDDPVILPTLQEYLGKREVTVRVSSSLEQAREEIAKKIPDGLLVDLVLPDGSGLELVDELKNEATQIIIMTGFPSVETAIAGIRVNAVDYLIKPLELARLRTWLDGFSQDPAPKTGPANESKTGIGHGVMIGASQAMQRVYKMIEKVAPSEVTVLLHGESGTGKEVAARAIHQLSLRKDKPLLAMNCGSVNENLIADELFGHERGGFTGANKLHKGYFERANGCTLFLDEITEMPIELQAHLLRVLETGKFVRIGGATEITTDVRLIAATNRDPREAIAAGKMREDLYYRLAVFPIQLPPLRERREDIDGLVHYFIQQFNEQTHASKTIAPDALRYLQTLTWQGNIRELKNVVQRAHLIADFEIDKRDFDFQVANSGSHDSQIPESPVNTSIDQVERRMILATLDAYQGNKRLAAQALGISLKTLYNKLKKYELEN